MLIVSSVLHDESLSWTIPKTFSLLFLLLLLCLFLLLHLFSRLCLLQLSAESCLTFSRQTVSFAGSAVQELVNGDWTSLCPELLSCCLHPSSQRQGQHRGRGKGGEQGGISHFTQVMCKMDLLWIHCLIVRSASNSNHSLNGLTFGLYHSHFLPMKTEINCF